MNVVHGGGNAVYTRGTDRLAEASRSPCLKELGIAESQKETLMSADDREKPVAKRSRKVRGGAFIGAGVAIGVALGAAMDNMGAGIAIGIAMGVAIGIALDQARK